MSSTPKAIPLRLGQQFPAANTQVVLYTVGASPFPYGIPQITLTSMYVSNLDFQNGEDLVSVWVVPSGASVQNRYAIANNYPIQRAENIVHDRMVLNIGDSIVVESAKGKCSFMGFAEYDLRALSYQAIESEIVALKNKVIAGTDTPADREDLMLLAEGAYVVQTNNNTNNCSCP